MAALDLADIPSGINTYERLATWAIQCLQSIANGQEVNVVAGQAAAPLAQAALQVTADGTPRWILSAYVPVDMAALNSGTDKTWMAAQDVGTAAPHINLLSN